MDLDQNLDLLSSIKRSLQKGSGTLGSRSFFGQDLNGESRSFLDQSRPLGITRFAELCDPVEQCTCQISMSRNQIIADEMKTWAAFSVCVFYMDGRTIEY